MAANAKGKRKVKGKTVDLNLFLADDQDAPSGFAVVQPRRIDWADAMDNEDLDDRYTLDYKKEEKVVLPIAPKAARGLDLDVTKIPNNPPYTAFLGNLAYDITEEDISAFFRQLQVKNVRIPREGDKGRIKGFGYAEFNTKQDLIQALALSSESLKNRAVKICLASEQDGERGDRRNMGPDRTLGDWRSGREAAVAREEPPRNDGYQAPRGGGFERDSYKPPRSGFDRDFGPPKDRYERNGDRYERSDFAGRSDRDFGGRDSDRFERRNDRGYGFSDRGMGRGGGREEPRERRDNFSRDSGRDSFSRDSGRDNFSRDSGRDGYSRDSGREMRSSDREYPPRDSQRPPERAPYDGGNEGRERRKLQLQPRTKPIEPVAPDAVASSSIFGAAKPVDTAAREREIEARLAREKDGSVIKDPKERDSTDARVRKFSSGSGISSRSRRSSDSGPHDEGDVIPAYKPPIPRQGDGESQPFNSKTRSRNGSSSSEPDHATKATPHATPNTTSQENCNSSEERNNTLEESSGCDAAKGGFKPARHNHAHRDTSGDRVSQGMQYEEPNPPVYTSANKFSHLMNDGEDLDPGSNSE